jgi:DNA invertase Pin-like site-specific DNA recombinase
MKAVGYTRLSQESDTSISSQKDDISSYCSSEGLELEHMFDEGEKQSGFDDEREQYQAMKEYLSFQDVDAVVVRDLSRLSRDRKERVKLLLELDDLGVELHSTERGEVDISKPWTLTIETIKATSDDVQKRKEIERSKKEIEKRQEKGFYQGKPPLGLQMDEAGEHLVVDQEEIEDVREIFQLRSQGYSYPEIEEASGVPRATAYRVVNRKPMYQDYL